MYMGVEQEVSWRVNTGWVWRNDMDEESCGGIVFYKHMSVESTFEPACIRASMFGGVPRTLIAQKEVKEEREKGKGKEDETKINHCQSDQQV